MTKTHTLPNGNLLMFHVGVEGEDFVGPNSGYVREGKGDGWAVDIHYMNGNKPKVEQKVENKEAKEPVKEQIKASTPPVLTRPTVRGK